MNRDEFVIFRDRIVTQRPLLRLDCMDPFSSMNYLKRHFKSAADYSAENVLDIWAMRMNMLPFRNLALASSGVRESLKSLFGLFSAQGREIWLPKDVYPFYWQAAQAADIQIQSFSTLPSPDMTVLDTASSRAVILITNPVSPLGRLMNKKETGVLKDWLDVSSQRRVVIDAVYRYARGFDNHTIDLFKTGQCVIAHSLSKAWLERGIFGVVMMPEADLPDYRVVLKSPSQQKCNSAFLALHHQADLPYEQQHDFLNEWGRLSPVIQTFAPDFRAPLTGYFSTVSVPYEKILGEYDTLAIPGSVFGSGNPDISVISCLHAMGRRSETSHLAPFAYTPE